jgi:2-octaprenyl-6-methoxyphenol hydroxylase
MQNKIYDIAIVGSGLVGSSLVVALHKLNVEFNLNLNIVIIDKKTRLEISQQLNPELDNRGIVLSRSSIDFLQDIQLWRNLLEQSYKINQIHISEQDSFGCVFLESKKFNLDYFGYLIPIADLINTLNIQINCTKLTQAVKAVKQNLDSKNWQIILDNNESIESKLLIASDGDNSFVREYLNIPTKVIDYQKKSLVANLNSGHTRAFQRFTKHGIYALLPFGKNKSKFILSGPNNIIDYYLQEINNKELIAQINHTMSGRIPIVTEIEHKTSYNLKLIQALQITGSRLILIGNAANTLPPVMAQGYNLGLRDVAVLVKLFKASLFENKNIDYNFILNKYASLRAEDHRVTTEAAHCVTNIFEHNSAIIKTLRKIGLAGVGLSLPNKNKIVYQGVGYAT